MLPASTPNKRRHLIRVGLLLILTGALLLPLGAPATAKQPSLVLLVDGKLSIVTLGDSYTAGNGTGSYFGSPRPDHYRSPINWSHIYALWLRTQGIAASVTTLARSGDTTADVLYTDEDGQSAQLDLNPIAIANADLIMLTIGGNDAEFSSIVEQCFVLGMRDGETCKNSITVAQNMVPIAMHQTREIFRRLESMVDTSHTEVVLVGYPFISTNRPNYVVGFPVGYAAATGVRKIGELADRSQQLLVRSWNMTHSLKVRYISDISARFEGHEPDPRANSNNNYRWLNEFFETAGMQLSSLPTRSLPSVDKNEWYHPNITGHLMIARALIEQLGIPAQAYNKSRWANRPVDVVFVVDTSTACESYLAQTGCSGVANLKEQATLVIDTISRQHSSAQFGVVEFRGFDHTAPAMRPPGWDTEAKVLLALPGSASAAKQALADLDPIGRNLIYWERSMFTGIMTALDSDWRAGATKIVMVLSSLAPDEVEAFTFLDVLKIKLKSLRIDPVEIYALDLEHLDSQVMQDLVEGTNGVLLDASTPDLLIEAVDQAIERALSNPLALIDQPAVIQLGQEVTLDAGGSYSPHGQLLSFEWDFQGDGVWDETTTTPSVTHLFTDEFDGVVGVRVTDETGRRGIGSVVVQVTEDGDWAPRGLDNCPDVYNWSQVDSDGDGLGDECDSDPGWSVYLADDGMEWTDAQVAAWQLEQSQSADQAGYVSVSTARLAEGGAQTVSAWIAGTATVCLLLGGGFLLASVLSARWRNSRRCRS
jgi:lysophospholipase L1-like esterase